MKKQLYKIVRLQFKANGCKFRKIPSSYNIDDTRTKAVKQYREFIKNKIEQI